MSYNAELQANNTDLQNILDTINNLPSGGETYNTVYISATAPSNDLGVDGDICIVRS